MTTSPGRKLVTPERREEDAAEATLRPQRLSEFIGQEQARKNLGVFIEAARARREALDHVLFVGPPGLGKTTLAQIVARELGVNFRATSGPVIAKAGDLAALLTNLEERDVLFIDEIHRLNPAVEEILYPAMEDFQLDLIIGAGPAARSVKIDLAKFTLIGATTRAGLLTNPLRDRFGIPVRLNFYSEAELEQIVNRGARVLGIGVTADGANEIARRARGTPRIAGRLLRRLRDFAAVAGAAAIDRAVADKALAALEVDAAGLDAMDRRYLTTIAAELRRRPGRRRDARRRPVGAARRHRGHHRALSDPVRFPATHPARPADHRPRLPPSRPARTAARSGAVRVVCIRRGIAFPANALFQIAPRDGLGENRHDGGAACRFGDNDFDFGRHRFVFRITGVPALRPAKTVDLGQRDSGRVVEPNKLRISRLEGSLHPLGDLLRFLGRSEWDRIAAVLVAGSFAALVDGAGLDQPADRLRALPDRIASGIERGPSLDFREVA